MKFTKPSLTFKQQAATLINRGMIAQESELVEKLQAVNYYRLSGYWLSFQNEDNSFLPGTTLEKIWERYTFDRQLRILIMDAIERVEVSIRTRLAYEHSQRYGAFGYTKRKTLPSLSDQEYGCLLNTFLRSSSRSKEKFALHFREKYGDEHSFFPSWKLVELMTFGTMLTMYKLANRDVKKAISREYGIAFGVLESWLKCLNVIRNICAHHGRLWNKTLGFKPMIPDKDPLWHTPNTIRNDRVYIVLTILKYFLNIIAQQSSWDKKVIRLLEKHPDIPLSQMGMPEDWKDSSIWKQL